MNGDPYEEESVARKAFWGNTQEAAWSGLERSLYSEQAEELVSA